MFSTFLITLIVPLNESYTQKDQENFERRHALKRIENASDNDDLCTDLSETDIDAVLLEKNIEHYV